ncbi:MAG: hypothetical protein ACP5NF_07680 [Thermoanaerobaculum sp.]
MPWVVDGNNVACGQDREGVRKAVLALSHREKLKVVLFFDGPPPEGVPGVERLGAVEVRYVPYADGAIIELLKTGSGWRLVTSDRELAAKAKGLGAEVVSSRAFWRKLEAFSPSPGDDKEAVRDDDFRRGVTPLPSAPGRVRRRRRAGS